MYVFEYPIPQPPFTRRASVKTVVAHISSGDFRANHSRWRKRGKWPPIMRPSVKAFSPDKGIKMK